MKIPAELLSVATYDERGVPVAGRDAEFAALYSAGSRDLSLGRIFEGHCNGLGLVARFGTARQRAQAQSDVADGRLFGVWNTQDDGGVTLERDGLRASLAGAKSWASGARFVARPIVTARTPEGRSQMLIVPLDRVTTTIDDAWEPLGMHASESFRIAFDDVTLGVEALIGSLGDYEREPWFSGGAIRFVAVQAGAIGRLVDETIAFLDERGRADDLMQAARIAHMHLAATSAWLWVARGRDAWKTYDAAPSEVNANAVVAAADAARTSVERAAFEVLEGAMQAVGARGLVEPHPFARLVRDLQMYLRQPATDAITLRVGRAAVNASRTARSAAIAAATGTRG